jgi:digeranylgeranylglycerophospholipid reductase
LTEEYDLIVVGGGPGGLKAGEEAAKLGLKTLILEKGQEIGVPVRCGEGLSSSCFKEFNMTPKKEWIAQDIKGAIVYAPSGKKVVVDYGKVAGYVLERKMFEKGLAILASKAGAKIQVKTTVMDLIKENGFVNGVKAGFIDKENEYKSKIVIGADGIESKVGRMAGLKTNISPIHVDSGFQYEMTNIDLEDQEMLELYFGEKISPRGYVWVFPKGKNRANVGIGIGGHIEKSAKHYLDKFIKDHKNFMDGSIIEVNGGAIPVGGFLDKMTTNGLMLIGDAAHQVNPIHGGGIFEAMTAGKIAAEVAKEAIEKNDCSEKVLIKYQKRWWEERGNHLLKVQRLREVFERLTDNDMEILIDSLKGEDLVDFSSGKKLRKLGKLLMKNPRLITLARKLI